MKRLSATNEGFIRFHSSLNVMQYLQMKIKLRWRIALENRWNTAEKNIKVVH
jgi:hypothetical protein